MYTNGKEDPKLGEGDSMPRAEENEGRASMPKGRLEGRSHGEDPTSETCRRQREKEQA